MKVKTWGLRLLSGLQFHCLKKGILAVEDAQILVLVGSPSESWVLSVAVS